MGYGSYDTPLGTAGYNVPDTCHAEDCTRKIDRGLSYLCGDQPGRDSEYGCGRWFCGHHLYYPGPDIDVAPGSGLCSTCIRRVDEDEEGRIPDPAGTEEDPA